MAVGMPRGQRPMRRRRRSTIRSKTFRPAPNTAAIWCGQWSSAPWHRPARDGPGRDGLGVMDWVGRPLPRYEDPVLLQGRGRYTADFADGARSLRFVRSPVARGRILGVTAPPGAMVITAADLDGVKPICPRLDRPDYVAVAQPILARERVTYVGEPIAVVIAETAAEAEDLAEQVEVEIDQEVPVVTLDQALAPGAPLVHDAAKDNTLIDARFETPGVDAAFAAAHAV